MAPTVTAIPAVDEVMGSLAVDSSLDLSIDQLASALVSNTPVRQSIVRSENDALAANELRRNTGLPRLDFHHTGPGVTLTGASDVLFSSVSTWTSDAFPSLFKGISAQHFRMRKPKRDR